MSKSNLSADGAGDQRVRMGDALAALGRKIGLTNEDFEDLRLAEQRLIESQAGCGETHTLEEVMKRYGLESK